VKDLESLLGCLNHVACIFHPMRHFLGRIYQALYRGNLTQGRTSLKETEIQDLELLSSFLDLAARGVSMNNLTFGKPTHIYRSDSSEFGMGAKTLPRGSLGDLNYW
jgi:hypothetical protein